MADPQPEFQSYFGLNRVTLKKKAHFRELENLFISSKIDGFNNNQIENWRYIRLLDTFFANFPESVIEHIINDYLTFKYSTQILILNPFSEIAQIRSDMLETSPLKRANLGLYTFRTQFLLKENIPITPRQEFESLKMDENLFFEQLEDMTKRGSLYGMEFRFYDMLSESPVYIISRYLAKGFMLVGQYAADSPWAIFVDDPAQTRDIYDVLTNNFISIWNSATPSDKLRTKISDRKITSRQFMNDKPSFSLDSRDRNLNVISIFLASSEELKADRNEVEIWINRENKRLIEKGFFVKLNLWEDFLDAISKTRLQDEYNKAIEDCDIFISLFKTKVGRFTKEEFEVAYRNFLESEKPRYIYTYFRDDQISLSEINLEDLINLNAFKNKLGELGHFYTSYTSTEDLTRQLKIQLDKIIDNYK